jgi:hypothetical protein
MILVKPGTIVPWLNSGWTFTFLVNNSVHQSAKRFQSCVEAKAEMRRFVCNMNSLLKESIYG